MSYFIADGSFGYLKQYEGIDTYVHHVVAVIILSSVVISGKDASGLAYGLCLAEVTSPFHSLYEFVKFHEWKPPLSVIVQATFLVAFVFFRGPVVYVVFKPLMFSDSSILLKIFMGVIWYIGMHYIWVSINLTSKILHEVSLIEGKFKFLDFFGIFQKFIFIASTR